MSSSKTNGSHLKLVSDGPEEDVDGLVGKTLTKNYTVLAKLGQGGMGAVYKAKHHTLRTQVAIKVLRAGMGKLAAERFIYEARTVAQVKSPHIVQVMDFFQDDDERYCLVMELVEGIDLGEVVEREGPLPVERVVAVVQQMAWALAAAHKLGIVHRDLKPENVMVTDVGGSDFVKIMDFGIAAVTDPETRERLDRRQMTLSMGGIVGTPEYMAPEQVAGDPPDARTDIYALGVVTYFLLTGSMPIAQVEGGSVAGLLTRILHEQPTPIGQHMPELAPLWLPLSKALAKDRADRYADVQAFADALIEAAGLPARPSRVSGQHQAIGAAAHAPTLDATGTRRAVDTAAPTRDAPQAAAAPPMRKEPSALPLIAGLGVLLAVCVGLAYAITLRGGTVTEPALEGSAAETSPLPEPEPRPRVERVAAPRPEPREPPRVERVVAPPPRVVETRPEPSTARPEPAPPPRMETSTALSADEETLLQRACGERGNPARCRSAVRDHCPACDEEQPLRCRLARVRAGLACPGGR